MNFFSIPTPGGIDLQARPFPLLIVCDASSSMRGPKIAALNDALRTSVAHLRDDGDCAASVHLGVLSFNSEVHDVRPLAPLSDTENADVPALEAGGCTHLGKALRRVIEVLEEVPRRCFRPAVVLISDGHPNDKWEEALQALLAHPRLQSTVRLALAIGSDANHEMLARFASPEYPVLTAMDAASIHTFFEWITLVTEEYVQTQGRPSATRPLPTTLLR